MTAMPEVVARAGSRRVRDLDVRPVLGKGGDPFTLIVRTVEGLGEDEALHLVVGFEPKPLYPVMRGFGRTAHAEQADGAWHVWFFKDAGARAEASASAEAPRAELKPPVEMDVRGLEPPQPMIEILEKLVELGPGAQLVVRHHREPVLLYEKLALRGYAARTQKIADGDYRVWIAPSWAFDEPACGHRKHAK
jgi:uncharacterized protein (DUF2249 family)